MDLEPTADQLALVEELRRALDTNASWDELVDMGILALPVPEADGGVGLGWNDTVLAFKALGRGCRQGPFVSTAAATAVGLADGATVLLPDGAPAFVEHLDR